MENLETSKDNFKKRKDIIRKVGNIFIEENLTTYDVKYICSVLTDNSDYKERKEIFPLPFELMFVDSWRTPANEKE